jgi:hypothetical protein
MFCLEAGEISFIDFSHIFPRIWEYFSKFLRPGQFFRRACGAARIHFKHSVPKFHTTRTLRCDSYYLSTHILRYSHSPTTVLERRLERIESLTEEIEGFAEQLMSDHNFNAYAFLCDSMLAEKNGSPSVELEWKKCARRSILAGLPVTHIRSWFKRGWAGLAAIYRQPSSVATGRRQRPPIMAIEQHERLCGAHGIRLSACNKSRWLINNRLVVGNPRVRFGRGMRLPALVSSASLAECRRMRRERLPQASHGSPSYGLRDFEPLHISSICAPCAWIHAPSHRTRL